MSVAFNGSNSKLQLNATLSISYPFSAFCWVKCDSTTLSQMVFGVGQDGTPDDALYLFADGAGTGKMAAFARDNGSNAANSTTSLSTSWTPALAVFASATSRTIYYGAGAAVSQTSSISPTFASINRITAGCRNNDTLHFDGDLAHLTLWSAALTQANFDSLAAGAVPSSVAAGSLYDYWELAAATATHTGANGRVLTASNTTTGATDPPVGGGALSGNAALSPITASGGFLSLASSLTGNATLAAIIASGSLGVAPGVVLVPELRNWGGSLQAGVTIPVVTVCRLDTGAQVLTLTNQVTSGAGNLTITNASLSAGVAYMVIGWNADGSQRFAAPIVAA